VCNRHANDGLLLANVAVIVSWQQSANCGAQRSLVTKPETFPQTVPMRSWHEMVAGRSIVDHRTRFTERRGTTVQLGALKFPAPSVAPTKKQTKKQ
jgi:hypothetical protein